MSDPSPTSALLITSGIDGVNHPKPADQDVMDVDCPKTPQQDNNDKQIQFGSPASINTHNPGFDNHGPSSPVPDEDEEAAENWEKDTTLLPQEHLEIGQHLSEYECSRAYNMI